MSFLRGLLWVLCGIALIAVAMYVTGNFELAERLTGFFLTIQPWLPLALDFDQFLVVLTVVSLLVVAIVVSGATALLVFLAARLFVARQKQLGQAAAAKREIDHVKDHHQRQYGQLLSLSEQLLQTEKLDKRDIVKAVNEATSRATSNSIVSCWLRHIETDTIRFEMGHYCDETWFTKTTFQSTEPPFARVISTRTPLVLSGWKDDLAFVRRDKFPQPEASSGAMFIPLLVENRIDGILLVFCHPDVLKSYEVQTPFYNALWGELALAVAIALQGEITIFDRLTGVHNREYFMNRLRQEIERANRFQLPLSLLMIDIDNFKQVNDTLGHPQGDAVLRIIAKLIKKEVRAIDLAGRYGGEEFIVMFPETGYGEEAANATGALVVAERIRKAVDEEFHGLQKPLNLTVSVGVAVRRFPQDRETDYRDLVRLADEQLYRAKTTGKNKVCSLIPDKPQTVS